MILFVIMKNELSISATELLNKIDVEKKVMIGDEFEFKIDTAEELLAANLIQLSDQYIRGGNIVRAMATLTVVELRKRNSAKDMQPIKRTSVNQKTVTVIRDDHGWGMGMTGKVTAENGVQITVQLDGGGEVTTHRRNVR